LRIQREEAQRFQKLQTEGANFTGHQLVEYMVMPNLVKKFREMGFGFTEAYPHSVIEDKENNIFTEVDITLRNGFYVIEPSGETFTITTPEGNYSVKE
jgi:hypothetical protein